MNLFDLPESRDPQADLRKARDRYAAAMTAYEECDNDETGDVGREVFRARGELELAERRAMQAAKG